jgi:hypothetical protein
MALIYNSEKKSVKKEVVINNETFYMNAAEDIILEYNKIVTELLEFQEKLKSVSDESPVQDQVKMIDEFTNLYKKLIELLFGDGSFEPIFNCVGKSFAELGKMLQCIRDELSKENKTRVKAKKNEFLHR